MKFYQKFEGAFLGETPIEFFPTTVPGNIQADYAEYKGWGNVDYGVNCLAYKALEDHPWLYRTRVSVSAKDGERVFFVTEGIEYRYDVRMNGKTLLSHEGMFSRAECDITDELQGGDLLEIYIYPHPKIPGISESRAQAAQCCKPAVEYGWDWHPRLLVSGIWNDTYIETRAADAVTDAEVFYTLSDDLTKASVRFDVKGGDCLIELRDPDGEVVYSGAEREFELDGVRLWWCNGQGEQALYSWKVTGRSNEITGKVGFRRVRLVMNGSAWDRPASFPKGRSDPPITVELNGRRIFAKGSNWVNPEIFTGRITRETYEPQIKAAAEAYMNVFRCWGGAIVNKESFFELCDRYGIMIWQEFPLACNNYRGTVEYLAILEKEATAIIKRLRRHPCLTLWCGGNELFNAWSRMTDQSKALRLLGKLTYELDCDTPFIPTSPVMGMAHGHYMFRDEKSGKYSFEMFNESSNTAYTEFGVSNITDIERLKKVMDEKDVYDPKPGGVWSVKYGYGAWGDARWTCFNSYDNIFGKQDSLEAYIEKSVKTQCLGYKYIFEEARRQWPECSMAINWCFNEPWTNAAGNSLLYYGGDKKECYASVREALRPVCPTARIDTYAYRAGGVFSAELWLLNDSGETVSDTVSAYVEVNGKRIHLMDWQTGDVEARTNRRGHRVLFELPADTESEFFKLILESSHGSSSYELLIAKKRRAPLIMNDPLN